MEIKTKLAALLRRWAYALHPETHATLPPGYQVAKVVSRVSHLVQEGKMPPEEVVRLYRDYLTEEVLGRIKDFGYIRHRADIHPVPGGLVDYEASLYVGFIPEENKITITPNKNKQLC